MGDEKKVTEKTEVKTESKNRWGSPPDESQSEYKKETTVKTEEKVEKDKDDVVVVTEE